MPEHLTFFGEYTNRTESLYWKLQELYKLERLENLTQEQKAEFAKKRIEVRSAIHQFRALLHEIEQAHGLEPSLQVIRPAIADEGN